MTAGSGIIHQEMPGGQDDGLLWGFQLWANLPAKQKIMSPRYRDVKSDQIPEVTMDNGVRIKVICGEVDGEKGPVQDIVIDPQYLDVTVPPNTIFKHRVNAAHTVFAYIIEGEGDFDIEQDPYGFEVEGVNYFDYKRDCKMGPETLVLFDKGNKLFISTEADSVRFLLISGKPIGEPVAWHGPIVMNTQEELRIAFEEYQKGTFIK